MECYEGATMIKTFRALIVDGGQDTIVLHTNDGSTGYRITKFQIMPNVPGTIPSELVVKIYKVEQTLSTIDGVIDFSDNTLLGAAYAMGNQGSDNTDNVFDIVFDQEIFNQDIYITNKDVDTGMACNYYIELEQIKLDLSESTVATLKDIRNITEPPMGTP